MPDFKITKTTIITVAKLEENSYKDLLITDTEGNEYKIKNTRTNYFKDMKEGLAYQLNWSNTKGTDWILSAEAIGDKLHTSKPPETLVEAAKSMGAVPVEPAPQAPQPKSAPDKMSKDDWDEKDRRTRKSIERQTSLNAAVELAKSSIIKPDQIILSAIKFATYLEKGE